MEYKTGERLQLIREIIGLTREEFSEILGIDQIRLKNMEQTKCRVAEDEFEKIGLHFPQLLPWLAYEGDITMESLKESDDRLIKLAVARIQAGQLPKESGLEEKIK